jgi:hypothetical protein
MKKLFLVFALACFASLLYGQSSTVTNNNTIIIQGNVYYFQPSNTPSSPLPRVGNSNFIGNGSWYGENAARAWASISDWAVERCKSSSQAIRGNNNEKVYISQVHAYRTGSPEINLYWDIYKFGYYNPNPPAYTNITNIGGIVIYYWIVRNGERMEDGRREYRYFLF